MTSSEPRLDYAARSPELFNKLARLGTAIARSGHIDATLSTLVDVRASQMNGCAFCLDMHVKEARLHGERELRLHHIAIWRESPLFSAKERAALALTEALTAIGTNGVDDALHAELQSQFDPDALSTLVYRVAAINAWNRLNVAFRTPPGKHDKALGLDKAALA